MKKLQILCVQAGKISKHFKNDNKNLSIKWLPPCLFRDYDAVDESDILNIRTYSLVKNKKMSWVIKQVFVASLGFSGSLEIKCVALISE